MSYTTIAIAAVVIAAALDFVLRTRLLCNAEFWRTYAILLGFQLVVNGILTGLPVVRYDPSAIIGTRVAFAPVEDLAFGWALILLTLTSWVYLTHDVKTRKAV